MDIKTHKLKMPTFTPKHRNRISYTKDQLFVISKSPLSQQVPQCFLSNISTIDIPLRQNKKHEGGYKSSSFYRRTNEFFQENHNVQLSDKTNEPFYNKEYDGTKRHGFKDKKFFTESSDNFSNQSHPNSMHSIANGNLSSQNESFMKKYNKNFGHDYKTTKDSNEPSNYHKGYSYNKYYDKSAKYTEDKGKYSREASASNSFNNKFKDDNTKNMHLISGNPSSKQSSNWQNQFNRKQYGNMESNEPEWFTEGPISHLDKMELTGFEDAPNKLPYKNIDHKAMTKNIMDDNYNEETVEENRKNSLDILPEEAKDLGRNRKNLTEDYVLHKESTDPSLRTEDHQHTAATSSQPQPMHQNNNFNMNSFFTNDILLKEGKRSRFHALFENYQTDVSEASTQQQPKDNASNSGNLINNLLNFNPFHGNEIPITEQDLMGDNNILPFSHNQPDPFRSHTTKNIEDDIKQLVFGNAPPSETEVSEEKCLTPFEKLVMAVKKQESSPRPTLDYVPQPEDAITEEDILRDMQAPLGGKKLDNASTYGLFDFNTFNQLPKFPPHLDGGLNLGPKFANMEGPTYNKELTNPSHPSINSQIQSWIYNSQDNRNYDKNIDATSATTSDGIQQNSYSATQNVINHFYSNAPNGANGNSKGTTFPKPREDDSLLPSLPKQLPSFGPPPPLPALIPPWYNQQYSLVPQQYRMRMLAMAAAAAAISNPHPVMNPLAMFFAAPPHQIQNVHGNLQHHQQMTKGQDGVNQAIEMAKGSDDSRNTKNQPLNLIQKASTFTPTAVFRQMVSNNMSSSDNVDNRLRLIKSELGKVTSSEVPEDNSLSNRIENIFDTPQPTSLPNNTVPPQLNMSTIANAIEQRQMMLMNMLKNNQLHNMAQYQQSQNFPVPQALNPQHLLMLQHQYTSLLTLLSNNSNNLSASQMTILQSYFAQLHSAIVAAGLQRHFLSHPYLGFQSLPANYFYQNLMNSSNNPTASGSSSNQNLVNQDTTNINDENHDGQRSGK